MSCTTFNSRSLKNGYFAIDNLKNVYFFVQKTKWQDMSTNTTFGFPTNGNWVRSVIYTVTVSFNCHKPEGVKWVKFDNFNDF